jgi:hypothetical protein
MSNRYYNCNNSNNFRSAGGNNATKQWYTKYLASTTTRLSTLAPGFSWTVEDSYNAQSLCAYETVAFGFSPFCSLFSYSEWQSYEYSIDIQFAGGNGFASPTGRAIGIGYVQEILARLQQHTIDSPIAQINVTLDNNTETFPLDQQLNFDFSHDTNIMSVLTAFGFRQFAKVLPADRIVERDLVVSHLVCFVFSAKGVRFWCKANESIRNHLLLVWIWKSSMLLLQLTHLVTMKLSISKVSHPSPFSFPSTSLPHPPHPCPYLSSSSSPNLLKYPINAKPPGNPTKYIHFILNQRTIPLHLSFPECETRDDGWCTLDTFLAIQSKSYKLSQYDWSCNGEYPAVPYGDVVDGVPVHTRA